MRDFQAKRPYSATDRTQISSSSESGRLPQGGNPTAQILNGRYDNVRVDGDAKVHTGDNVYQQSAGGDDEWQRQGQQPLQWWFGVSLSWSRWAVL
jgi:hypothetical protein